VDEDEVRRNEAIGPEEIDDFVAVLAPEAGEVVDDVAADVDAPISLWKRTAIRLAGSGTVVERPRTSVRRESVVSVEEARAGCGQEDIAALDPHEAVSYRVLPDGQARA